MTKCFLPSPWIKVGPTQAYCPLPMAHVHPNMPPRSYQKALWAPMLFKQDLKMPPYPYHTVYTPPYRPWLMRVTKHVTTDVSKYVAPASLPPNRAFLTPSVDNLSTMCLIGLWHLDEWRMNKNIWILHLLFTCLFNVLIPSKYYWIPKYCRAEKECLVDAAASEESSLTVVARGGGAYHHQQPRHFFLKGGGEV